MPRAAGPRYKRRKEAGDAATAGSGLEDFLLADRYQER
jgi:hypothetical protein